ncbi:MAG: hypothetical protein JO041_08600 [Acidobacteria bacterium]|nr:hypothetical protein [Acidobacteriota bacterium]
MRKTAAVVILAACAALACSAQSTLTGTWKLNESKSKLAANAPKNSTVVYSSAGDQTKVTIDGTDANGNPAHNEWIGKFDGKDYPVTGDPGSDARAVKKVDDRTFTFVVKKGGKETAHGRIVVSPDGMSRTVTNTLTDASGKKTTVTQVYDKQM